MLQRDRTDLGPLPRLPGLESLQPGGSACWPMVILALHRANGELEHIEMPPGLQQTQHRATVLHAVAPRSTWLLQDWEHGYDEGRTCIVVHYQERVVEP